MVEKGKTERRKDEKGFKKQGCLRKDARERARKGPRKDAKGQRKNCLPYGRVNYLVAGSNLI